MVEAPPTLKPSHDASSTIDPLSTLDPAGVKRRLAAIAFADVAGFSHMMSMNDVDTIRRWKTLRKEIMEPHLERHGGRVVDVAGDALLVEFPSAVSAVGWAVDVQRTICSRDKSQERTLQLRIGINVDDVIDDGGALHADGINIASRIHEVAAPGQIVLTAHVRDYVINRLPVSFRDLGVPPMKNINRPIHVLAVDWEVSEADRIVPQPYLQWSTRPTLAVLPFRTMGQGKQENYFGEGITEEIITNLARSRSLYVIARTSTLRYRGTGKDIREIAAELNVHYVLNGSVRRQAERLRINTEMIDVVSNRSVWAERFDGSNEDLFEFQDRIAGCIVASLEPRLRAVETERIASRPTDSLDAYDCVLKAVAMLYKFTDDSFRDTDYLLNRAVELDPSYAQAYAHLAWRLNFWFGEGRSTDRKGDIEQALAASQHAIALDPHDSFALTVAGQVLALMGGRPKEAVPLFDQALQLNENSAFAWGLSALTYAYLGRPEEALDRMQNVWRLSPFDPVNFYFWVVAGIAEFVAGRYSESIMWLKKSNRASPRFIASLRMLAAAHALAGNEESAKSAGRRLIDIEPTFRIKNFVGWYPLQRPEDRAKLSEGLKIAGLPA